MQKYGLYSWFKLVGHILAKNNRVDPSQAPFFIFEVSDLDKEGLFLKQVSFWYPPFQKVSFLRYKMPLLNLFSLFVEEDL